MNVNDFIANFERGNENNAVANVNDLERDGNTSDVLFRFEQAQNALTVSGGTTLTNISPYTAIGDLAKGKLSVAALIWLALAGLGLWWLMKKR